MPLQKKFGVVLCVGILAISATACAKSTSSSSAARRASTQYVSKGDKASFYLRASSQSGDGKTISIDRAIFTGTKGYVAIHSDASGSPGLTIGVSKLLAAGRSNTIRITLNQPLTVSAKVFPMLHLEDNNNRTYDFPSADTPAKVGVEIVVVPIKITVS